MELLAKFGNKMQKDTWLVPLLDGKIRSAFLMTEPDIASSDATNVQFQIEREGDEYVKLEMVEQWSRRPQVRALHRDGQDQPRSQGRASTAIGGSGAGAVTRYYHPPHALGVWLR